MQFRERGFVCVLLCFNEARKVRFHEIRYACISGGLVRPNVEVRGLRGFLRSPPRLPGYASCARIPQQLSDFLRNFVNGVGRGASRNLISERRAEVNYFLLGDVMPDRKQYLFS